MEKVELYSHKVLKENLNKLMAVEKVDEQDIVESINRWGIKINVNTLKDYTRYDKEKVIGADKLYALAHYFGVAMDGLLGRVDIDRAYIDKDPNSEYDELNLTTDSEKRLRNINNMLSVHILNQIICQTNLVDVFTKQLEYVKSKLNANNTTENEDVIYFASCKVQREIDRLFKKCLNEYIKK